MKKSSMLILISFSVFLAAASLSMANELQVIPGAGPSTAVVQLFVEKFQTKVNGYAFKVPPKSAKHAGGIKGSDKFVFGRTGRPLNDKEKAMGKEEIFLGQVPIAFSVGTKANISSLKLAQLEQIFTAETTNWKAFGGTDNGITTIGREPNEALFSVLKTLYPFFANAQFKFVVKKDNHVIDLLGKTQGEYAIGFGSQPNFQKASMQIVPVEGFSAGVSLGLVYDIKNKDHELVIAAKKFVHSSEWHDAVEAIGMMPPK